MASAINDNDTTAPHGTHAVNANCASAMLTIGTPPPATINAAVSRKANTSGPGGVCDLALLPGVKTETRDTRISEVRIAFNQAPGDPDGTQPGVTLQQRTCASPTYAAYSGASTVTGSVSGSELVLSFNPALENTRTYRIDVGSIVTSVAGQFVEIRGLVADVDDSGAVDFVDRGVIVGAWTSPGSFSCKTDLNGDGATNAVDRGIWTGAATAPVTCAP
jgi:hypothetical protein